MATPPAPDDVNVGSPIANIRPPKVSIEVDALLDRAIGMATADTARHIKLAASSALTVESLTDMYVAVVMDNDGLRMELARLRSRLALAEDTGQPGGEGAPPPGSTTIAAGTTEPGGGPAS